MSNTYDTGWGPLDVAASPIFSILETAAQIPGINNTQFGNWLYDTPIFRGAQNFRADQPGWALATDIGATFVPFIGWGAALNKAKAGAGLLQSVNSAGRAAASLAPRNAPLAFALGETVRYAPISAAMTGFDLAGGKYNNPIEALVSFGLGSAAGAGIQAAGHALSPFVTRIAPTAIGGAWRAAFEPGPQLSALYGFDNNVQQAARLAARDPVIQEALSPTVVSQVRAGAIWDILHGPDAATQPPEVLDVLRGQYDQETRAILREEIDPSDVGFRVLPTDTADQRRTLDNLTRMAPTANGARVRVPITGEGNRIENPDVLAARLQLPDGWIHDTHLPGLTQVTAKANAEGNTPSLDHFRRQVGLDMSRSAPEGWRRLERATPNGLQTWTVRQEPGTGQWLVVTEVPVGPGLKDIHRMTGRANYNSTKHLDKAEPAKVFFSFKTHNPSKFFPHMRADFDAADAELIGNFDSRIPRGRSKLLDKAVDFKNIFLNPNTIRAAYAAKYGKPGQREAFVKSLLSGPTFGKEIAQLVERYAMPTQFQLRDSPQGRAILSMYEALFDAAESRARSILHGTASIPEGKNPMSSLFAEATVDDADALASSLRRLAQEDPNALEIIRQFIYSDRVDIKSIEATPAGQWLTKALKINLDEINDGNNAIEALKSIGATDARTIPIRKNHIGISRRWDGSVFVPIYAEGSVNPVAIRAGNGKQEAERKAAEWIAHFGPKDKKKYRAGQSWTAGETDVAPRWLVQSQSRPGLLEPRLGMRGYEHEYEPFKHIDDLIALLEEGYVVRQRYIASTIADALTGGKFNQLKAQDPKAWQIVNTRIMQLKGQAGPLESRMNQIVDSALAPVLGTNSFSKIAEAFGEFNFHMLHGVGNIATPFLNLASVLQTQLPAATMFLTADINTLKGLGFHFPAIGGDGLPTRGFNWVTDPWALIRGGFRKAMSNDPEVLEVYNQLNNRKVMGNSINAEYNGQDRTIARRVSEGIRDPSDIAYFLKTGSGYLMAKTEQISRVQAAGMALQAMEMMEKVFGLDAADNPIRFTMDQKIKNAQRMVELTNYGYFTADRPTMYTGPLGSIFGNQKTWMTNYFFSMVEYLGMAQHGNFAPLLMTLGTTTALGGVFAVPFAGSAIDAITETFADKDATEFMFSEFGEAGNAISFGLPSLFGMSLTGNVAAPGSNLAHDTEFFFTIVALERAKLMGRAIGRGWDDQVTLGMNPLQDPLFGRQMAQAFAPRALYRTWEAIASDSLHSAATGYPLIRDLGWGARIMHGMGFRDTEIAIQYAAYERLLKDKAAMTEKVTQFGEAYAMAMVNDNRRLQAELLQQAALSGVDISRVMASARTRLRNHGLDMFGRNFNSQQLEQYQATLEAGGL